MDCFLEGVGLFGLGASRNGESPKSEEGLLEEFGGTESIDSMSFRISFESSILNFHQKNLRGSDPHLNSNKETEVVVWRSRMLINRETGRTYYDLEENTSRDRDDCMEQFIEQDNCIDLKKDGRLFLEYPLYCEGQPKPICRGVLHLVCAILLPTVLLFFIRECHGSTLAIFVSVCYVSSNIICYGASG
jgi:hypothetical protein